MTTRNLELSLKIIADAVSAVREIRGVALQARELGVTLSRTATQAEGFETLRQTSIDLGTRLNTVKDRVRDLGNQLVAVSVAQNTLANVDALRTASAAYQDVWQRITDVRTQLDATKERARDFGQQLVSAVEAQDKLKDLDSLRQLEGSYSSVRQSAVDLGARLSSVKDRARELGQRLVEAASAEDQLRDVQSLQSLQRALDDATRKAETAREALRSLQAQSEFTTTLGLGSGARPDLSNAQAAANAASQTQSALQRKVNTLQQSLAGSGIDTSALADEESRLRLVVAGFESLRKAYTDTVADSRTLSSSQAAISSELAALAAQIQAVRGKVGTVSPAEQEGLRALVDQFQALKVAYAETIAQQKELERSSTKLAAELAGVQAELTSARANAGNVDPAEEQRLRDLVAQFRALEVAQADAIKQQTELSRNATGVQAQLSKLSGTLAAAGIDTSRLSTEQARLAATAERVADAARKEAAAQKQAAAVADARNTLGLPGVTELKDRVRATTDALATLRASGTASLSEITRGAITASAATRRYATDWIRFTDNFGAAVDKLKSFVSSAAAGAGIIGGGYGLVQSIGAIRDATVQYQTFGITLKAVTGSQQEANTALAFTRDLAYGLGLDLAGTTKNYADFAAASRGTRLEGDLGRRVFSDLSGAFSVLGLSSQRQDEAFLALNQTLGKSVVQAQELRLQLGNALPGAFELAARALNVTTQELNKLLETGKLSATDFLIAFAAQAKKEYGEGLPEAINSSRAAFQRFQTAIYDLKVQIGSGGVVDALTQGVEKLTAIIKDPEIVRNLTAISLAIVNGFGYLVTHAGTILQVLGAIAGAKYVSSIGGFIGSFFGLPGAVIGEGVGALLGGLAGGNLPSLLSDAGDAADRASPKIRNFQTELKTLGEQYAKVAKALADAKTDPIAAEGVLSALRAQIDEVSTQANGGVTPDEQAAAIQRAKDAATKANDTALAEGDFTRLKARLEATTALVAQQIQNQTAVLEEQFRQNLVGYDAYYRDRAALQKRALEQEIQQRRAELGGLATKRSEIEADQSEDGKAEKIRKLAEIDAQRVKTQGEINVLKLREIEITLQATNAINAARDAEESRLNELDGKVAERRRDVEGVGRATLAKLQEQFSAELFSPDKSIRDRVGQFIDTQVTQAQFDTVKQQAQDLTTALQTQFATLSQGVSAGTITQTQAQEQFLAALAQAQPSLQGMLAQLAVMAQQLGPQAVDTVNQLTNSIQGLALQTQSPIDRLLNSWKDGMASLKEATASWLDRSTDALATFTTTGKANFKDFANSIIHDLVRIGYQQLLVGLFGQITGAIGGGLGGGSTGGGGGGLSAPFLGSGGIGGQFVNAFPGAANGGLIAGFADGGSVQRFDQTQDVVGPGTSTSDSILADVPDGSFILRAKAVRRLVRLSNGERFISPRDVRKIGLKALNAINGGTMPTGAAPGYAKGGAIGSAGAYSRSASAAAAIAPTINVSNAYDFRGAGPDQLAQLMAYGEKIKSETIRQVFEMQRRRFAPV